MTDHIFWALEENLPKNIGYKQFSKKHISMLIVVILFTFFISYAYTHSNEAIQSIIRISMALTLVIIEILKLLIIHLNHGDALNYIPIEICSIAAYCILIDVFSPNTTFVREMLLILFLPAAIMALIYPTSVSLPVFNFFTIHQFVFHGLIVAYVTMRFVAKEITISYLGVWQSIITISFIAFLVYIIDCTFKRNYMFLTHDENNFMLKKITMLSGGGKKYTLTLVLFCAIVIHIFYFIFTLIKMFILS